MSDAKIKMLQDAFAAFGRGDLQPVFDLMTPDVTWGMVGREEDVPFLGIRSGKDGAGAFFKLLNETTEITVYEPQTFLAADDKVFVWGHVASTMRHNGVPIENDWLHVYTFRDGKICEFRGYSDTALQAAAYNAPAMKSGTGA